jgi:hypothetical protein
VKTSQIRTLIFCISIAVGLSVFQNCAQVVSFNDGTGGALSSSLSVDDPNQPTDPENPANPNPPPATVVCDPFNQANIVDPRMGIEGSLYSAGGRLSSSACANSSQCTSRDYIKKGTKADAVLFLSQIFVPTRDFTAGFSADGQNTLKDANNQDLVEWFALDLHSQLVLDAADMEGDYQIAVVSDDGHTMDIQGTEFLRDEGEHSPQLKCSSSTIHLTHENAYPFRLTYFQGPRTQISLVMMWRRVDATTNLADCGTSDGYIADQNKLPSSLRSRGWKIPQPSNFQLEAGKNLCSP